MGIVTACVHHPSIVELADSTLVSLKNGQGIHARHAEQSRVDLVRDGATTPVLATPVSHSNANIMQYLGYPLRGSHFLKRESSHADAGRRRTWTSFSLMAFARSRGMSWLDSRDKLNF